MGMAWCSEHPHNHPITTTTNGCTTSALCSSSISSLRPKKINPAQPWKLLCWATKTTRLSISQLSLVVFLFLRMGGGETPPGAAPAFTTGNKPTLQVTDCLVIWI